MNKEKIEKDVSNVLVSLICAAFPKLAEIASVRQEQTF